MGTTGQKEFEYFTRPGDSFVSPVLSPTHSKQNARKVRREVGKIQSINRERLKTSSTNNVREILTRHETCQRTLVKYHECTPLFKDRHKDFNCDAPSRAATITRAHIAADVRSYKYLYSRSIYVDVSKCAIWKGVVLVLPQKWKQLLCFNRVEKYGADNKGAFTE